MENLGFQELYENVAKQIHHHTAEKHDIVVTQKKLNELKSIIRKDFYYLQKISPQPQYRLDNILRDVIMINYKCTEFMSPEAPKPDIAEQIINLYQSVKNRHKKILDNLEFLYNQQGQEREKGKSEEESEGGSDSTVGDVETVFIPPSGSSHRDEELNQSNPNGDSMSIIHPLPYSYDRENPILCYCTNCERLEKQIEGRQQMIKSLQNDLNHRDESLKTILNEKNQFLKDRNKFWDIIEELHSELEATKHELNVLNREREEKDTAMKQMNKQLMKFRVEKEKEEEQRRQQEILERQMRPRTDVYLYLASPSYEKDYLPIMERMLCDLFDVRNTEDVYRKKNVRRYSANSSENLPPPGSTVLYTLYLSANCLNDQSKKAFLAELNNSGVNVIVCLMRKSRGAYLPVESIRLHNDVTLKTVPFMINQKVLSQHVEGLKEDEKTSLRRGYWESIKSLRSELLITPPNGPLNQLKNFFR